MRIEHYLKGQVAIAPARPLSAEVSRPFHFLPRRRRATAGTLYGRLLGIVLDLGCWHRIVRVATVLLRPECYPCVLQRLRLSKITQHTFRPVFSDAIFNYHARTSFDVSRHSPAVLVDRQRIRKSQNALRIRIVLCTRVEPASLGYTNIYDILDMRQVLSR